MFRIRLTLLLSILAVSGCTSYLTSPSNEARIDESDILGKNGERGPDAWGLHVVAADKKGTLNRLIYRQPRVLIGDKGYVCKPDQGEENGDTIRIDEEKFDACQIGRIIGRLKTQLDLAVNNKSGSIFPSHCSKESMRVMIFIHGGLNATEGSLARVREETQKIIRDCAYPIFLNWEAGFFSSYLDQVMNIRGGRRVNSPLLDKEMDLDQRLDTLDVLQRAFAPFYVVTDLAEAVARAPVSLTTQGLASANQLRGVLKVPGTDIKVSDSRDVRLDECENTYLINCEEDEKNGDPRFGHTWDDITSANNVFISGGHELESDFFGSIVPFTLSPARLATTPLVDSFGETAWNSLLRTTYATFESDLDYLKHSYNVHQGVAEGETVERSGFDCSAINAAPVDSEPALEGAFFRFATAFQKFLCDETGDKKNHEIVRVDLVSHSMGTIIANEMIDAFDLCYDNIVHLAAASSIRHFSSTVVPYIERRQALAHERVKEKDDAEDNKDQCKKEQMVRFYNLMLHPWHEARETSAWGLAPAGSLLVWIDSMYEHSDSAFDRTLG